MSSDVNLAEVNKPSLKYLDINLGHTYTNILLISDQVREYQTIVDSANANTYPIIYSSHSSKTELLTLLQTYFTTIDRIGICYCSKIGTPEEVLTYQIIEEVYKTVVIVKKNPLSKKRIFM